MTDQPVIDHPAIDHVDVLVVGAGLSGIGAACHLAQECPEKSYAITKALEESSSPTQGLDLVASGRLDQLSDGRVIHCAFADGPPACVIAAKFDRIAIENPADGSVLGEWSNW